MRYKASFAATLLGLTGNGVLCLLKLSIGLWTSSLALLSDGLNSLTDVISSVAIFIAVKVSDQEADEGHPFGHHRAEPIAGLMTAIFAAIAGFEILREAVVRLFSQQAPNLFGFWPFAVLIFSITVKIGMTLFLYRVGRRINSPAILAGAVDSRTDILVSATALVGVSGAYFGTSWWDSLAALVISLFIFRAGWKIGTDNIDYLMGKSPSPTFLDRVTGVIRLVPGVAAIDSLRAHYVGNYIHVEAEITVSDLSTRQAHDLEEYVKGEIEKIEAVDKAFVHLNPVQDN